jgi:hypothetical protein
MFTIVTYSVYCTAQYHTTVLWVFNFFTLNGTKMSRMNPIRVVTGGVIVAVNANRTLSLMYCTTYTVHTVEIFCHKTIHEEEESSLLTTEYKRKDGGTRGSSRQCGS